MKQEKQFTVYILTNKRNSVLYVGVTSDLVKRIWQHKEKQAEGFTEHYNIHKLVYYELLDTSEAAISREKKLKRWRREWKVALIEERNPNWDDLYDEVVG